MKTRELSPREAEIVGLCIEGLTNEAIAQRLGLSLGTVNTYWVRIKLKVGGLGKTYTVARIIKQRADQALDDADAELARLAEVAAEKEVCEDDYRTALALLDLATDQIKSTAWATDCDLVVDIVTNAEDIAEQSGVSWEAGKTVYEFFATDDPEHLAVAAHLAALKGEDVEVQLEGKFSNMALRVQPLTDDSGHILGCLSILNSVGEAA